MIWKPISERAEFMEQPCRQFILLEGCRDHSGVSWRRQWAGEAFIRKPGEPDEMLQYRKSDILRLCKDGDMDPYSASVTHWMPAIYPAFPIETPDIMKLHDETVTKLKEWIGR